jgi:hypothetical protein
VIFISALALWDFFFKSPDGFVKIMNNFGKMYFLAGLFRDFTAHLLFFPVLIFSVAISSQRQVFLAVSEAVCKHFQTTAALCYPTDERENLDD